MILFKNIVLQQKSTDDWRAFLTWVERDSGMAFELRGYGSAPDEAAKDAWNRFNFNRDAFVTDSWEETE